MHLRHICYRDSVPADMGKMLVSLYQSAFCVFEYFELSHYSNKINALAIYTTGSNPDHVIYYTISGSQLSVLNENFDIDIVCLEYFVRSVFHEYPKLKAIHFNRLRCGIDSFSWPRIIWNKTHDIVLELPETMAAYRSLLGKRTKANMSNYSNKLRREFDFSFDLAFGKQIDPSTIREIISLNRMRMRSKGMISAIDAALEERIIRFSQSYGIVGTVRLDGRIAAGTICYGVGGHCYADVIAHDPAYNKYSIGQVCIYLMIQSLIERGMRFFHMAGGDNDYKFRLLGVGRDLYSVSIFRSELIKKIGLFRHIEKHRYVTTLRDLLKYQYVGRIKEAFSDKRGHHGSG
jgi:hypothetical protein